MTKNQLFAFMKKHRLAVLSTADAHGQPQSALIGIAVSPELEIIFDTVKSSRKYGNLIKNSAVAFVVGCTGDETLQYQGIATELSGTELKRYQPIYFDTFKDGPSRLTWSGICYFAVRPTWIRFSDYGDTPTLIEEFKF